MTLPYNRATAKAYAREHLRGIWAAAMTPFRNDLSIDEAGFRRNLRHWFHDLGIDGVFVAGKQGEFFSMSVPERKRTFEIAVDAAKKHGFQTIMSCSDQNMDVVIDLAKHAEAIGADYIVVHAPVLHFFKAQDETLSLRRSCREGVCGSCRVLVRRATSREVETALGCQTLVEEGMEVNFLVFPNPTHHTYGLEAIPNSWEVQQRFHTIFPEADHCRHCGGCDRSCPKGIQVEEGVRLASRGRFREAGELFIECVMCNFCMTACPEFIAPNHVGLFARRVTAYFHIRPSNLIRRLEEMRRGELEVRIDEADL